MRWQEIVTMIAVLGGPAGLVSVIMLLPQIRKLQADTNRVERDAELSEIEGLSMLGTTALAQMDAAVRRAERAEQHGDRLEKLHDALRRRMDEMEQREQDYRDQAQAHVAWDWQIVSQLESLGVDREDIPVPPPLLPKRRPL